MKTYVPPQMNPSLYICMLLLADFAPICEPVQVLGLLLMGSIEALADVLAKQQ